MAILTREELKNFFKKGSMPTEQHFNDLIDSMVLKSDFPEFFLNQIGETKIEQTEPGETETK